MHLLEHGRVSAKPEPVPGLYEDLVDAAVERMIEGHEVGAIELCALESIGPERSAEVFARYLYLRAREVLAREQDVEKQRACLDRLLHGLELAAIPPPSRQLLGVADPRRAGLADERFPTRPRIPLAESELLVNARDEIDLAAALCSELPSADRVDLVCSFIRFSGLPKLLPVLRPLAERGRVRVLTTTYTGVTEPRALERLAADGAAIRVDYGGTTTRLHAKAWLLQRDSGLSTAFVGSSNISRSALVDGREWNVRLSRRENPDLLDKLAAAFEAMWQDDAFEPFEPERFEHARARAAGRDAGSHAPFVLDLRPHDFQDEVLDKLAAARALHDRRRNLIVAATGTGKTMIAAFDYRRMRAACPRLLFVAHRKEILEQARASFAAVLREPEFGELLVDGQRPRAAEHLFASIQSLKSRLAEIDPRDYDYVVIDEFHHAEAKTYRALLEHLRPRELLGLTATPERADGRDVTHWFDGHVTAELRLWDALARGWLCPFHYYGVADDVDLSQLAWSQGGYVQAELERVYTGNHARVRRVLAAIQQYVSAPASMRALGFCVSVEHARFMAAQFEAQGIAAALVVGATPATERAQALSRLRSGSLRVIFCVDVFNEGVDLPEVDTLLFLRPTESPTVFLQQLGRGLRKSGEDKITTVLDFIGNAHRRFRFDLRLRALLDVRQRGLVDQVEQDFPWLPPGCAFVLEKDAKQRVLDNVRHALAQRRASLVGELRRIGAGQRPPLDRFLAAMQWQPEQLYRTPKTDWSYTSLVREAGLLAAADHDDKIARGFPSLLHVGDRLRLSTWSAWLRAEAPPRLTGMPEHERRLALMLLALVLGGEVGGLDSLAAGLRRLWRSGLREELLELLGVLEQRTEQLDLALELPGDHAGNPNIPLRVHARYTRDELLAACGELWAGHDPRMQTGMRVVVDDQLVLNLVTIDKSQGYSPKTQYRDYAVSRTRFHSESPHTAGPDTPLGRRIIARGEAGCVLLFVRARKDDERGVTNPYVFLGPTRLERHEGDRPMQLHWSLAHPIPAWFHAQTRLMG
jgi:superfamily II DNA or RNA helicase